MSYDFNKVNKGIRKFDFQLPKDAPYVKLQDTKVGDLFQVLGFFISKSNNKKYSDHPVAVIKDIKVVQGGFFLDLPAHTLDSVNAILSDDEAVADVNAGQCGIKITEYENDMGKFKGIEFTNIN